ncbi:MAG TPA: HD domain-containing phosphohydrolase [Bacillales bacterium]|nr:HD domain-containing phosphohydrolase [Bacillales bacterium]
MKDPEYLFHKIAQDNTVVQYFKNHSMRVMFLASSLAKRCSCYDENLRVAALLHDIGKMGISKQILFKPEKLNDLEYVILQTHPHTGNLIVRKQLGMPKAAEFIRDHHERWDGHGYPRGLKEEEISIQGRVIAVCDAFDTMTMDNREYNPELMDYTDAYNELKRNAWTQFDGSLVEKFIGMMGDIRIPDFLHGN